MRALLPGPKPLALALLCFAALLYCGSADAAPAPAPGLQVNATVTPSNLPPGGTGFIELEVFNAGAAPTSGQISVTDVLPAGVIATEAGYVGVPGLGTTAEEGLEEEVALWNCNGAHVVSCTNSASLPAIGPGKMVRIAIKLEVLAISGEQQNTVTVSGGSAAGVANATNTLHFDSAPASFALERFDGWLTDPDGSPATRAGSHPYALTIVNDFTNSLRGPVSNGPRNLDVQLPPGFIGDPAATLRCTRELLDRQECPAASQVGVIRSMIGGIEGGASGSGHVEEELKGEVYNMIPPAGVPAQFAFSLLGISVFLDAGVRSDGDYGITEHVRNIPLRQITRTSVTIWGNPADPVHDPQRCAGNETICGVAGTPGLPPLLSLPTFCGPAPSFTASANSWREEFNLSSATFQLHEASGDPLGIGACEGPNFAPSLILAPETRLSDSPTGLNVEIHMRQEGLLSAEGLRPADIRNTTVALPAGLAINPSRAAGLSACADAEDGIGSEAAPSCPSSSIVGTAKVQTPLLNNPLEGSIYLLKSTPPDLRLLVAASGSGVNVKLLGSVHLDPSSGQLTSTFSDNPQLPLSDLTLRFSGGPQAALTTPLVCGTYTTVSDFTPWTAPAAADASPSSSFVIDAGPDGGPCATDEAVAPNRLAFEAGTLTPIAGAYSPFLLNLKRENGSQRISRIDATLPEGLTGRLVGVPYCSDAELAAAAARSNPGEGVLEQARPSCPLDSQIGAVDVGAGSGAPLHVSGRVYLAGPYKGAPLSLAIITPAVAGPFDLGTVAVRTALYIDPFTAQIHAVSDPVPTILAGVPLDLRSITLNMDRPNFTLNPTSCDPMQVLGSATSTLGQTAALSSPFQVGACNALGFAPKLSLKLKGGTKRNKNPALTAVVTYPNGSYANIAKAQVTLPHSEFLDNEHIRTVCTRVQFAAKACPAASIYGHAMAITSLLDKPLSGPVYLRSSSHKLPDLVADLNGQIEVTLDGKIDTGKGGGIRNTFQMVPDAPVSKFVLSMQGGKKGLLVNSENICARENRAISHFVGQNGKVYDTNPVLQAPCGGKAKKKGKGHKRSGAHR